MASGMDFQLVLYALAAEHVAYEGRRECVAWAYVPVGQAPDESLSGAAKGREQVGKIIEQALAAAELYIGDMRAGRFEWPEECTRRRYCPYVTVCRFEAQRVRRRTLPGAGGGGER